MIWKVASPQNIMESIIWEIFDLKKDNLILSTKDENATIIMFFAR